MTRPDEIDALADQIERYRNGSDIAVYSGPQVANILQHWMDRLSAVREALEEIRKIASTDGGLRISQIYRIANTALATAEKAGDYSDLTNPELSEVLSDLADFHHEDAAIAALAEAKRRLDATPTPPSGDDVAWLIAEIESKKIHYPADPDKLARFNRIKASIQSAAHGGGTKSDGGVESRHAFENGRIDDCKTFGGIVHPLSPSASDTAGVAPGPSDPAQEPQAVALKPCPFCKASPHKGFGKVHHDQLHGEPQQDFSIWCPKGHAKVTRVNAGQAAEEWNTRPALDREALTESNISHEICHVFGCRETCDAECNADHGRSKCGEAARRIIALLEGRT